LRPLPPPFPYTTLFRSQLAAGAVDVVPHFPAAGGGDMALLEGFQKAADGALVHGAQAALLDLGQGDEVHMAVQPPQAGGQLPGVDRKSTRLNSSHVSSS